MAHQRVMIAKEKKTKGKWMRNIEVGFAILLRWPEKTFLRRCHLIEVVKEMRQ